jgi:hypothetical protein
VDVEAELGRLIGALHDARDHVWRQRAATL